MLLYHSGPGTDISFKLMISTWCYWRTDTNWPGSVPNRICVDISQQPAPILYAPLLDGGMVAPYRDEFGIASVIARDMSLALFVMMASHKGRPEYPKALWHCDFEDGWWDSHVQRSGLSMRVGQSSQRCYSGRSSSNVVYFYSIIQVRVADKDMSRLLQVEA